MENFKIDRIFCKAQSLEQANKSALFDTALPAAGRLRMAFHLSSIIHGIKEGDSIKLDRTIFSAH